MNTPLTISDSKAMFLYDIIFTETKNTEKHVQKYDQGWLKLASLGGSSYKEINPVSEAAKNRIKWSRPLNPVKLRRKWTDLA